MICTFVTVNECVLDYHGAAIDSGELFSLPSHLPKTPSILDIAVERETAGHAQHMAR